MRTRIKWLTVVLAATVAGGGFYAYSQRGAGQLPGDLRDAVADGAYQELKGAASGLDSPAPTPAPKPAFQAGTKAIHGVDDRLDYYEAAVPLRVLADSVVSMWYDSAVKIGGGNAVLGVITLKDLGFCPGQKFVEQPAGAFCTGALVGEDLMLTAGHCVPDQAACGKTRFVFDYAVRAAGVYPYSVPAAGLYSCKKVVKSKYTLNRPFDFFMGGRGPDFALVQLDRKVRGRRPLMINRRGRIPEGEKVFIIGHPFGLPVKISANAKVRDASPKRFFVTDLDTFGGNSGSPVFNARTALIEGIHVRAEALSMVDTSAGCRMPAVYAQQGGVGADANNLAEVSRYIP